MLNVNTVGGKEVQINPHMVSHLEKTKEGGTRIWVPAANLYFDVKEEPFVVMNLWTDAMLASGPLLSRV